MSRPFRKATMDLQKVYVVSVHGRTGGIECTHQLCEELNASGIADAAMVYVNMHTTTRADMTWWGVGDLQHEQYEKMQKPLYSEKYKHLKSVPKVVIPSGEDTRITVVIPEIVDAIFAREIYPPHVRIVLWWLSWDNASTLNKQRSIWNDALKGKNVEHAFQSRYAQEKAESELGVVGWYLPHYITFALTEPPPSFEAFPFGEAFAFGKRETVLYNPAKDSVTPIVCREIGVQAIPIRGMTPSEVRDALTNVGVYVDFGSHPGKDRLPCEAALSGCVVVTNRRGSAGNEEDVPIAEKCDTPEELAEMLKKVLGDVEGYRKKQEVYRVSLYRDFDLFKRKVLAVFG